MNWCVRLLDEQVARSKKIFQLKNGMIMPTEVLENMKEKVAAVNPARKEGPIARAIESQTAKLPSDVFLWASIGAMATSLTLKLLGKDKVALFIGQWSAPFLMFGLYNKIVKVEGHDKNSRP
jgi:hypothetical protein